MSDLIRREDVLKIALEYTWGGAEVLRKRIRALPAVQPDAREAALREAAEMLDKRHRGDLPAHIMSESGNWVRALIDKPGKEVMPSEPIGSAEGPRNTAPAGNLTAGGGAGQMADTPMITGLVASNLTARGNAATWALYDANLTRMGALQPAHVNETPKREHDAGDVLTPATKGGTHD